MSPSLLFSLPPMFTVALRFCSVGAGKTLTVGAFASTKKTISAEDVKLFSEITGDWNLLHHQNENSFVHGALLNGLVSGVIGTQLPGPGTILLTETLRFPNPCHVGDSVFVNVVLTDIRRIISCKFNVTSETTKKIVLEGEAKLMIKNGYG